MKTKITNWDGQAKVKRASGSCYTEGQLVNYKTHCTGLVTVVMVTPHSEYWRDREDVVTNACFDAHFKKLEPSVNA